MNQDNTERPYISVISPVYGADTLLDELVTRISAAVQGITEQFEIILVEDNSPDHSWQQIEHLCRKDSRIIGIRLSRNFGQQYALNCGLDHARGEWVFTIDCDLQDAPEQIPLLFLKAQEGYDIVLASRSDRQDGLLKRFLSSAFYKMLSYLTETRLDASVANFALYHRNVVIALSSIGDYARYYPAMIHWVGFRKAVLSVPHLGRKDGKESSYNFKKRMDLALNTIISVSNKPLRLTIQLGISIVFLSTLFAFVLVIRYLTSDFRVSGWMSIFVSIWFLSGIIITVLGMVGLYLGKIFENVKQRPRYIVHTIVNIPLTKIR